MNPLVKSVGQKYGLILAAIGTVYYLIAYLVDVSLFVSPWQYLMRVGFLILLIVGVSEVRKGNEGFITFREAFATFMIAAIISVFTTGVVTSLLYFVIDPTLPEQIMELSIEQTMAMMEKFGGQPEQMDEALDKAKEQGNISLGKQWMGVAIGVIFNAILGLIVAAFFKKDRPVFETVNNEE